MNGLGDQFFARSRFAGNQNRSFGGGDAIDQTDRFVHRQRTAHDLRQNRLTFDLRSEPLIGNPQASLFSSLAYADVEFVDAVRLGQIIVSPDSHRLDGVFNRALTGQHDYFGRIRPFMNAAQKLHTIHVRHVDVAQKHVNICLLEFSQRGFAIRRYLNAITQALQFLLQH